MIIMRGFNQVVYRLGKYTVRLVVTLMEGSQGVVRECADFSLSEY